MIKINYIVLLILSSVSFAFAQSDSTIIYANLTEVTLRAATNATSHQIIPAISGTQIFAGKKTHSVDFAKVNANVVSHTMRQVLNKVAGIHIWESDGSGLQIGIATRGLSPNRSWDFNVRMNNIDIAADPYGYPEAYFNPPLEAVKKLNIVKGAGSLSFGPQIGGTINYELIDGANAVKPVECQVKVTHGSFGLKNLFTSFTGKYGKLQYAAFGHIRQADGWRNNSSYTSKTGYAKVSYALSNSWKLGAEVLWSNSLYQQPGGLHDSVLSIQPTLSLRSRNWMNIDWKTYAVQAVYEHKRNKVEIKTSYVDALRANIGYTAPINQIDSFKNGSYLYNRLVDVDYYKNYITEVRWLYSYRIGKLPQYVNVGLRYFDGTTQRFRNGIGDKGTDYTIKTVSDSFPTALQFDTKNVAFYVENLFQVTKQLKVIPALRWEQIQSKAGGILNYFANGAKNTIAQQQQRQFILFGLSAEYDLKRFTIYANANQSYRPIQFGDLSVNPTTDVVDPNLQDSRALNLDLGVRAILANQKIKFNSSLFYLNYDKRIGTITQFDDAGRSYNFRTNVGNSISKGIESLVEIDLRSLFMKTVFNENKQLSLTVNYTYTEAKYDNFVLYTKNTSGQLVANNYKDKWVENAPQHIVRTSLNWIRPTWAISLQHSFVDKCYADASNIQSPNVTATTGVIPSYQLFDVMGYYKIAKNIVFKAGVNNVGNLVYFTRRSGGYPGPGALPGEGRSYFTTLEIKL